MQIWQFYEVAKMGFLGLGAKSCTINFSVIIQRWVVYWSTVVNTLLEKICYWQALTKTKTYRTQYLIDDRDKQIFLIIKSIIKFLVHGIIELLKSMRYKM